MLKCSLTVENFRVRVSECAEQINHTRLLFVESDAAVGLEV